MGVMTGTAVGADKEHGAQLLNAELQDKGVSCHLDRRRDQLGAHRQPALDDLWSGLLCGGNDAYIDAAL